MPPSPKPEPIVASQRIRELFGRAVDLPRDQWPALLDRECPDPAVRRDVERLLERHNPAHDDFLESPAATIRVAAVDSWANSLLRKRIGQYTLTRLIAAGGMGCVFEARQEHPQRDVAVKILPPGTSAPSALARFRLEPEMLGRLQHPNIAQVFESGIHDGELGPIPYFAMELIRDARSIVEFAAAESLDIRSRLEMFSKVCDAVHHGHQKSVIHRDLKPANILVGADGEPKVIDFGIARATDADLQLTTRHTHVGDLIGTVRYMSPEQCDGDSTRIDTRSDVYSLGVVLYELLTGQTPYETTGTTIYAAVRMIKDDAPRRPSDHVRSLRGDVDAIVLKSLEKDPSRRYGSAADLAQDIRRHLAHETIEARPPTVMAKVVRWVLRRPMLASAVASGIIFGLSVSGAWFTYRYMVSRPALVTVNPDRSIAQLSTAIGHPLRRWTEKPGVIRFGEFLERPAPQGGGPVALIGFRFDAATASRGSVALFDLRRASDAPPEEWRLGAEDIPANEIVRRRGKDDISLDPDAFGPTLGIVADVFDYPAGVEAPELVCIFKQRDVTHSAICVFGLDGRPLYRIWIDADIYDLLWVPGPRVLLCRGVNGEVLTVERAIENPSPSVYHPTVLFAIRPTINTILSQYLAQETSERETAPEVLRPLWYLCVLPLSESHPQAQDSTPRLFPPEGAKEREHSAHFQIRALPVGVNIPAGVGLAAKTFLVDAATGTILRADAINEYYRHYEQRPDNPNGYFPPYDSWTLGELPPKKQRPPATAPAP